jgi:hypothetical protein
MSDVQAALDAMAAAEQEAREFEVGAFTLALIPHMGRVNDWARDRVRLIERDRNTLELHAPTDYGDGELASCEVCGVHSPCDDLQAVIGYWCHDEEDG